MRRNVLMHVLAGSVALAVYSSYLVLGFPAWCWFTAGAGMEWQGARSTPVTLLSFDDERSTVLLTLKFLRYSSAILPMT